MIKTKRHINRLTGLLPLLTITTLLFVQSGRAETTAMKVTPADTSKLSFHGYGELHFHTPKGTDFPENEAPAEADLHRMVWGISYDMSDWIILHTGIDFEQAQEELQLEFVYLHFLINPLFNVRVGSLLVPVGPLNEFHEPPLFYSVSRPYVQRHIIPTTWQEAGIGVFGTLLPGLNYRAYILSSLDARRFDGVSGIRNGRRGASEAESDDLALVLRSEYTPMSGVDLGLSLYNGGADASKKVGGNARVQILEWDVRLRMEGFDLQWVSVLIDIDDAAAINAAHTDKDGNAAPLIGSDSVGTQLSGTTLEAAYHLSYLTRAEWDLVPFVRFEAINTQDDVPAGFSANPANDREILTVGTAYYPHPQVVLKLDRESWEDGTGRTELRYNLGAAYMF
ncbi:MAG: hypothetical protein ACE5FZ_00450 [Nitrospiria bacterium]